MKIARFLAISLMMICIILTGCGKSEKEIHFGTAGIGGKYYAYGTAMADMISIDNSEYKLDIKNTSGSAANLRLLNEQFLDMAIVQSDILAGGLQNKDNSISSSADNGYAAVAGLYTEACQIIVPKNSEIQTVYDLEGKRVSIGEKESGVLKNAEEILSLYGLTSAMLKPYYLSFNEAAEAMSRGEIDAFFCTAGAPTKAVEDLAAKMEIRLLSIAPNIINNMEKAHLGYTQCIIPENTYPNQTEKISTFGVKAVLVARSDLEDNDIEYMVNFILNNAQKLHKTANVTTELDLDYAVEDIPCPFHKGAANYYKSKGIDVEIYTGSSSKKIIAGQD